MSSTSQEGAGLMDIQTENLQSEFKVLADVYSHVTIHNELKFVGTRAGFKVSLKEAVNVICNSAKYIEVILKVLTYMHRKSVDPKYQVNQHLQEIYLCAFAMLRYLQEEHATLQCESDFGQKMKRFYQSLLKNTSSYPPGSLEKLELAGRMATLPSEDSVSQALRRGGFTGWNSGPRGRFRNIRFCGRGFGRGSFQSGGEFGMPTGSYNPRSVPFDCQANQE